MRPDAAMYGATVLVALGLACTGDPSGRESFMTAYCDLLQPCCAGSSLPADGAQCRALLDATLPGTAFDVRAGDSCLAGMRASSTDDRCQGVDEQTARACDRVFVSPPRAPRGRKPPGERCDHVDDCAPSDEGQVTCEQHFTASGRSRICQVQIRGREGDGPCLYTVPDRFFASPYPVVIAVTQVFSRGQSSESPPPRTYLCYVADGLRCDDSPTPGQSSAVDDSLCVKLTPVGADCTSGACVGDAFCEPTARTCQPRSALGAGCTPGRDGDDSSCVTGAFCHPTAAACQRQKTAGEPCTVNTQCRAGACVNETCRENTDLSLLCGRSS
jgi:hypothetical protein